jgi:hypothetical protein
MRQLARSHPPPDIVSQEKQMSDEGFSPDKDALESAIKRGSSPSEPSESEELRLVAQYTPEGSNPLAREWGWQGGGFGMMAREWGWQGGGFGVSDIPEDVAESIGLELFQPAREWGWWETSSLPGRIARTWGWEAGGWQS